MDPRADAADLPWRSWAAFVVAAALVGVLTALDADLGGDRVITTTVVLGPIVAGLLCGVRQTAVVAAAACVSALLSGVWTTDALSFEHGVRECVVYAGSILSVLSARERARLVAAGTRLEGLTTANAGLSSELALAERRLGVALDAMAAAVLIQRPGEGIVYANQAAADAMGLPTAADVVAATPEELAGGWISFKEDGTRLTADEYPSRRILLGLEDDPPTMISRGLHRVTGREMWMSTKATKVPDEEGDGFMAVSVSEDITAVKRAELVQRLYAQAGRVLSSSLDVDDTLAQLAELVVPELADWCTVSLPGEGIYLRQAALAHRDPGKIAFAEAYYERFPSRMDGPTGVPDILRGGPSLLLPEIPDSLLAAILPDPKQLSMARAIGLRSIIQVPVGPPVGPPLGVLNLVHAESGRIFTRGDLEVAEELGRRAGVALQNARLYAERSQIAATLQDSLLPDLLPQVPGFELAAFYRPAGRRTWVGGDFYDAFETPRGWVVVVGDVAGHGAEAAALTAQARHSLRTAAMLTGDLVAGLEHLNEVLTARERLSLCTICAVLLPAAGAAGALAEVVCAGHPLPVRVRDGQSVEVGEWGTMVGAFKDARFSSVAVALEPGDLLVLYTDGVLDAVGDGDRFGDRRLQATVAPAGDAEDAVRRVDRALTAFAAEDGQGDDIAVLALGRAR